MATRIPARPDAPADWAEQTLAELDRLELGRLADPLREPVDRIAGLDDGEVDLLSNTDGLRRRLIDDLDDGTVTPDDAATRWAQGKAEAAAAGDVRAMIAGVRGRRSEVALAAFAAVPWWDELVPLGLEAAATVVALAEQVGPAMSDSAALRATDKVRRAWLDLGRAVDRWSGLVALAQRLTWAAVAPCAPIEPNRLETVPGGLWRWRDPLVVLRDTGSDQVRGVLAAVTAGAGPTFATPAEVAAQLARRERIREANRPLLQLGVALPGVDVPEQDAARLPGRYRELWVQA